MKDLKTSELLDKVNKEDLDDVTFGDIIREIDTRTPFNYLLERISELENGINKNEKEITRLWCSLSDHTHLPSGKSVKEI